MAKRKDRAAEVVAPAPLLTAVDPITRPWRLRPATGSDAWVIVETACGDMLARVAAPYGELFRSLPELLEAAHAVRPGGEVADEAADPAAGPAASEAGPGTEAGSGQP